MGFFISEAWAQDGAAAAPNMLISLLPLVALFVVFYFLLIRPQTKRAKEHRQLLEGLSKGDEIVSNGGIAGKVIEVGDHFLEVEIADKVVVKLQKQAVSTVLPKGSLRKN